MSSEDLKLKIAQLDELARAGRAILATIEAECKPAPERDICIRPEPEVGDHIVWLYSDGTNSDMGYERNAARWNPARPLEDGCGDYEYAWERRRIFLTRAEAERAADMELLRARAITARDAINGERGLPKEGDTLHTPFTAPGEDKVMIGATNCAGTIWRFWSEFDAHRWLSKIGGDAAFRKLMEVE